MIAAMGPADYNYEESISTLRFANRAKSIKNKPKINEDPKDAMLRDMQDQIAQLKALLAAEGDLPEGFDISSLGLPGGVRWLNFFLLLAELLDISLSFASTVFHFVSTLYHVVHLLIRYWSIGLPTGAAQKVVVKKVVVKKVEKGISADRLKELEEQAAENRR